MRDFCRVLHSPALFCPLFCKEKSAGDFKILQKLLTRQFYFHLGWQTKIKKIAKIFIGSPKYPSKTKHPKVFLRFYLMNSDICAKQNIFKSDLIKIWRIGTIFLHKTMKIRLQGILKISYVTNSYPIRTQKEQKELSINIWNTVYPTWTTGCIKSVHYTAMK